jgi:hypothetical protein
MDLAKSGLFVKVVITGRGSVIFSEFASPLPCEIPLKVTASSLTLAFGKETKI